MKPFDYPFSVNGKEYALRYSFKSRREFENKYKKSVPGLMKRLIDPEGQMADDLINMFVLLLSTNHPEVTNEQVEKIIEDMGGEDEAMTMLTKALEAQMGDEASHP